MALLITEGFEWCGASPAAGVFTKKWTSGNAYAQSTGRNGTGYSQQVSSLFKGFPNTTTLICGFGFYCYSFPSVFAAFDDSSNLGAHQVGLGVKTDGYLELKSYTSVLATSSVPISTLQWNYYELKATISNTVGTVELKLNGTTVASATGVDTSFTNNEWVNLFYLNCDNGNSRFDDIYLCDTTGSYCNDFLGDITVEAVRPTADSSPLQFTPSTGSNYACVDEAAFTTTDYVTASTSGYRDQYAMGNLSATPTTIHAVVLNAALSKTDSGSMNGKLYVKSSSSEDLSSAVSPTVPLGNQLVYQHPVYRDPNGSIAWTKSAVDAMECGIEVV